MNSTILELPKHQEFQAPSWLSQCLFTDENHPDNLLVCRAFDFANQLHQGQYRKSGEAYIAHPVAVAKLLKDLGGDSEMIAAGFLHDVVEDTDITPEEIELRFGKNVRQLVEAVTKLSKLNFSSKTERQAENFRRMFLAMAKDIRVIVVKLADRLHNMRTLEFLSEERQKAIATETREIFAPLANRLGIWRFKWELEDLAFKYLEPQAYNEIKVLIAERRGDREEKIDKITNLVSNKLEKIGIHPVEVKGRPKHLYGIYQKMQRQNKEFEQIYDIAALRIIVNTNEECYRSLAVVHDAFRPIPGRFKDYIGLPKPNGYQSLHTTVFSLNKNPLEIQIRTNEMHQIAEYGVAAHWKYKETGHSNETKLSSTDSKFTFIRQVLELQSDCQDAKEYYDNLRENLFDDDVYVFTPQGDVISLARGSTSVDFAYRIHTEIGNHTLGAKINGKLCPLEQPLKNGDIVEIMTSKNSHPSLDWLNFVVTPSARNRIRQWYKRSHREENIIRGKESLERELGKNGLDILLKSNVMQTIAEKFNYQKVEDLLAALGYGEITALQVANRLTEFNKTLSLGESDNSHQDNAELLATIKPPKPIHNIDSSKFPIAGIEGLLYHIARCCNPLPGEPIMGVVTNVKGISIHHQECHNLASMPGERLIPIRWNNMGKGNQTYPVNILIEVIDRVAIFRDILDRLSDQNINVSKAGVKTYSGTAIISLTIDLVDCKQFSYIVNQIKNISDVLNIRRLSEIG
jgi:GTP pyrophosphokinase